MTVARVVQLFCTGGTGYIGGDFLVELKRAHPDWLVTCLTRNSEKSSLLLQAFPGIRTVIGTLDSVDLIEDEVRKADITLHFANCDHVASAKAIARGLAAKVDQKPVYWIHTSGAGILTFNNFAGDSYGHTLSADNKVFDDWDNVAELTSLPPKALHRHVDTIVLSASNHDPSMIKTAIVCPPCIYGQGRGPGNQRSVQIYVATEVMLKHKRAVKCGSGSNIWNAVHIQDLSRLYLLLVEAAVNRPSLATWNSTGYYLAENGEFKWGDLIAALAKEAQRQALIESSEVQSIGKEEALRLHRWLPYLTGTTSRGSAIRARTLLRWNPVMQDVYQEIPDIIRSEVARLSQKSHKF